MEVDDLLVQQVRSLIGADEDQRTTIRSLGLGRIGRCSVACSARPSALRQIHAVRHLVALAPLTVAASERLECAVPDVAPEFPSRPAQESPSGDRERVRADFGERDWLEVGFASDKPWVRWTTALPLKSVLRAFDVGQADDALVWDQTRPDRHRSLASGELVEVFQADHRRFRFARFDLGSEQVLVVGALYPKHVCHEVVLGEVEVAGESLDWAVIRDLIERTGSPLVSAGLPRLDPILGETLTAKASS